MPPPGDQAPRPGQLTVMVSSTSLDLPEHRKAVMDAILRAECFPLAMEHGTAQSSSDAIRYSLGLVDRADVYLGIFGHRYGYVPEPAVNPTGWSVTEHEYRRAVERGIPTLIFLMHDDHLVTKKDIDLDVGKVARLEALKAQLQKGSCAFFKSPQELHSLAYQALIEEKQKQGRLPVAAPGAGRAVPLPPEFYAVPPYTLTDAFVGRRAELAELDAWAGSADPVMVVEAIGGMGKSALTWQWTQAHAEGHIPQLAGRIWWSFYERGTSMKSFLRHALAYVSGQDPETLRQLNTHDCGQRLLDELRRRPFLLVLDGFERVLAAYHRMDKAHLCDDRVPADRRECTNPRDGDLLRWLVHCGPSRVLVSTRLMPRVLEAKHTHRPIPGVRHLQLEGLAPDDALAMVRNAGVRGDRGAILRFADQLGRHALVLRIVCGMVANYPPRPGDFDAWRADPLEGGGLKLTDLELKQRYTPILEHAFRGLGEKTRLLLSRIAVLSDSADYDTIAVLNPFLPADPGEPAQKHKARADFHAALRDLEERGLLQWDRKGNTFDLHAVVRAYAFEQLEEGERTRTYNALCDHFSRLPPENVKEATELSHVRNSIETMRALIGAGRFTDAMRFYRGKFAQRLWISIGAYHIIIELLSALLRCGRDGTPVLTDPADRSYALNELANALYGLGRYSEAARLNADKIALDLATERWGDLASGLDNYSKSIFAMNRLGTRCRIDDLRHALTAATGNEEDGAVLLLDRMALATTLGRLEEAEELLVSFRQRRQPSFAHYRPGGAEYYAAILRFYRGRLTAEDLDQADQVAGAARSLLYQTWLSGLRAEWELTRGRPEAALEAIEHALSVARRTGNPTADYLSLRTLALAHLGHAAEAREALAEGAEVWPGRMPRFPVFAGETCLALGDHEQARAWARQAYPLAWADGPPYCHGYYLQRCRQLLAELGEPEPQLPPFDPTRLEPIPYEAEIRAAIEKLEAGHPTCAR